MGSGPQRFELEDRIKDARQKLERALQDPNMKRNINLAALDMVRYIDFFNQIGTVNFAETLENMPSSLKNKINEEQNGETKSALIDEYLMSECERVGQDNISLVKDSLPEALKEHQRKRAIVLSYATTKKDYRDPGAWSMDDARPEKPSFWKVPEKAVVDVAKRKGTCWEDLVVSMKDKIIP